jgi:hypothetical protein
MSRVLISKDSTEEKTCLLVNSSRGFSMTELNWNLVTIDRSELSFNVKYLIDYKPNLSDWILDKSYKFSHVQGMLVRCIVEPLLNGYEAEEEALSISWSELRANQLANHISILESVKDNEEELNVIIGLCDYEHTVKQLSMQYEPLGNEGFKRLFEDNVIKLHKILVEADYDDSKEENSVIDWLVSMFYDGSDNTNYKQ